MSAPKPDLVADVRFVRIPKSPTRAVEHLRLRYRPSDPEFAKVEELFQLAGWGTMNALMMRALTIGAPVVLEQLRVEQAARAEQAAVYERERTARRFAAQARQQGQQAEPVPNAPPRPEPQSALAVGTPATQRSEPGATRATRALVSNLLQRTTKGEG